MKVTNKKKGTRRERKKKNRFIYSQVDLLPCESRHCLIGLLLKQVRSMAGEEEEKTRQRWIKKQNKKIFLRVFDVSIWNSDKTARPKVLAAWVGSRAPGRRHSSGNGHPLIRRHHLNRNTCPLRWLSSGSSLKLISCFFIISFPFFLFSSLPCRFPFQTIWDMDEKRKIARLFPSATTSRTPSADVQQRWNKRSAFSSSRGGKLNSV